MVKYLIRKKEKHSGGETRGIATTSDINTPIHSFWCFVISNRKEKLNICFRALTDGQERRPKQSSGWVRLERKEIVCVFFLLAAVFAHWQRDHWDARSLGSEEDTRGTNAACFFSSFCKALASSKCLSHANKACLKLIELTEAASETKTVKRDGRRLLEQGKENSLQTSVFYNI